MSVIEDGVYQAMQKLADSARTLFRMGSKDAARSVDEFMAIK